MFLKRGVKGGTGNYKMNKKAQSQVITTVLIILLVLAAVVIVWQVVQNVVKEGGEEVVERANCVGLVVEITNVDATAKTVTIKPNKDIEGYRVYQNGAEITEVDKSSTAVGAFATNTVTYATTTLEVDDIITSAGKIEDTWCEGASSFTVE